MPKLEELRCVATAREDVWKRRLAHRAHELVAFDLAEQSEVGLSVPEEESLVKRSADEHLLLLDDAVDPLNVSLH